MGHPAPAKHEYLATTPHRKIEVKNGINCILHLHGGQRIIICSWNWAIKVWDLESGTQIGEAQDGEVHAIALSPDGKTVTSGCADATVKLWNIDKGKVIKEWTGHAETEFFVLESRRASRERILRWNIHIVWESQWDVESGETIFGPIGAGEFLHERGRDSPDA